MLANFRKKTKSLLKVVVIEPLESEPVELNVEKQNKNKKLTWAKSVHQDTMKSQKFSKSRRLSLLKKHSKLGEKFSYQRR